MDFGQCYLSGTDRLNRWTYIYIVKWIDRYIAKIDIDDRYAQRMDF